jgi:UDP-glucose 6-dehydrogenase
MKKVVIVGFGKVGAATRQSLDCESDVYDPYKGFFVENFSQYDYAIVCVDTVQTGPKDYNDLDSVLRKLKKSNFSGKVVVRSTVSPKKVKKLLKKTNFSIILFPEFLIQRDFSNLDYHPEFVVLGGSKNDTKEFGEFLLKNSFLSNDSNYRYVNHQEAAIIKLSANAILSSKVVMFNAIKFICDNEGASYEKIKDSLVLDKRLGAEYHSIVPGPDDGKYGFGGHCLPKDIIVISELDKTGYFNSVAKINNILRKK